MKRQAWKLDDAAVHQEPPGTRSSGRMRWFWNHPKQNQGRRTRRKKTFPRDFHGRDRIFFGPPPVALDVAAISLTRPAGAASLERELQPGGLPR